MIIPSTRSNFHIPLSSDISLTRSKKNQPSESNDRELKAERKTNKQIYLCFTGIQLDDVLMVQFFENLKLPPSHLQRPHHTQLVGDLYRIRITSFLKAKGIGNNQGISNANKTAEKLNYPASIVARLRDETYKSKATISWKANYKSPCVFPCGPLLSLPGPVDLLCSKCSWHYFGSPC